MVGGEGPLVCFTAIMSGLVILTYRVWSWRAVMRVSGARPLGLGVEILKVEVMVANSCLFFRRQTS